MVKEYIPFIIFASLIAICTIAFIIYGYVNNEDTETTDTGAEEGDLNQEQEG